MNKGKIMGNPSNTHRVLHDATVSSFNTQKQAQEAYDAQKSNEKLFALEASKVTHENAKKLLPPYLYIAFLEGAD